MARAEEWVSWWGCGKGPWLRRRSDILRGGSCLAPSCPECSTSCGRDGGTEDPLEVMPSFRNEKNPRFQAGCAGGVYFPKAAGFCATEVVREMLGAKSRLLCRVIGQVPVLKVGVSGAQT